MGAERWILFGSLKAAYEARAFLGAYTDIQVEESGVWLQWASPLKLEVGYSFRGFSSEIANLVCRELARRFPIRRVGADSVGWYSEKDWLKTGERSAPSRYGQYPNWAAWIKDYDPVKWSFSAKYLEEEEIRDLDAKVSRIFSNLDLPKNPHLTQKE